MTVVQCVGDAWQWPCLYSCSDGGLKVYEKGDFKQYCPLPSGGCRKKIASDVINRILVILNSKWLLASIEIKTPFLIWDQSLYSFKRNQIKKQTRPWLSTSYCRSYSSKLDTPSKRGTFLSIRSPGWWVWDFWNHKYNLLWKSLLPWGFTWASHSTSYPQPWKC